MNISELRKYCKQAITNHPELKREISDIFSMARDEMLEGGSEENECELAVSTIEDLIEEEAL